MRSPVSFIRRLLQREDTPSTLIQVLTPQAAGGRGPFVRLALAGVTVAALAAAGAMAIGALVSLMLALGVIYFLVTEVLGIRLELDPREFVERAQAYARGAQSN